MQLNSKITNLLFELSEVESTDNCRYLIGDGTVLRNNLLKLYRATKSKESHSLIIQIMKEAGYSWFEKLAQSNTPIKARSSSFKSAVKSKSEAILEPTMDLTQRKLSFFTEQEFLSLLPVNELVH